MAKTEAQAVALTVCDVHKASAVAEKPLELHGSIVTSMIQTALAWSKTAGALSQLRRHLKRIVAEWVRQKPGSASNEAVFYRHAVCDTLLSSASLPTVHFKAFSARVLNGDWRTAGCLSIAAAGVART